MSVLIIHVILLICLNEQIVLVRRADFIILTPIVCVHVKVNEVIVVFLDVLILPNRWDNALIADTDGRCRLLVIAVSQGNRR